MDGLSQLVVFSLEGVRYALPLAAVERVIHAVEVTPLPKAPEAVLGVVNMRGRVIPIINIRRRFGLPEQPLRPTDQFIVARTARRALGLVVDAAHGVFPLAEENVVVSDGIVPGMDYTPGVAKLDDGLVLIHDLDRFLSLDEEAALAQAMQEA